MIFLVDLSEMYVTYTFFIMQAAVQAAQVTNINNFI